MVQQLILFLLVWQISDLSWSQDERYYRQMLTGELPATASEINESPITPIGVEGPLYQFDLNGDGIEERLQPAKINGVDWLTIYDGTLRKIFQAKLLPMGGRSHLYKLKFVHLSKKVKALILFLDEGHTHGEFFESSARIFVLSFENNDFTTMSLTEGPHFYHELEKYPHRYNRRGYSIDVTDLDQDGIREIIVHYNHIQRIMSYEGSGVWKRI